MVEWERPTRRRRWALVIGFLRSWRRRRRAFVTDASSGCGAFGLSSVALRDTGESSPAGGRIPFPAPRCRAVPRWRRALRPVLSVRLFCQPGV